MITQHSYIPLLKTHCSAGRIYAQLNDRVAKKMIGNTNHQGKFWQLGFAQHYLMYLHMTTNKVI